MSKLLYKGEEVVGIITVKDTPIVVGDIVLYGDTLDDLRAMAKELNPEGYPYGEISLCIDPEAYEIGTHYYGLYLKEFKDESD